MNINEAKTQIKNAITAYFAKDEYDSYLIPLEKQRPVFLMGPPGIGKTAIMEQIASELGVGLISYSMTHHTRQSALGLPFIVHKNYEGLECDVSEYTMSEIIASVYELMKSSGIREGILFLDEINCVSETLAPLMLQFLQYKVFGRHRVPNGWIVVTAGNPPEYNNSVREFDVVTWDRVKRIDIEPDYQTWKEYAYKAGVHGAIISYLDAKHEDFYRVETGVDGKTFVTARGWVDLSSIIKAYETRDLPVDELLIGQYIQNPKIANSFAIYYDLFKKYRSDYQIEQILAGEATEEMVEKAKAARFDERLTVLGLLIDAVGAETAKIMDEDSLMQGLLRSLKRIKSTLGRQPIGKAAEAETHLVKDRLAKRILAANFSAEQQRQQKQLIAILERFTIMASKNENPVEGFEVLHTAFNQRVEALRARAAEASAHMGNAFRFIDDAYGADGQETLIFVTELTMNYYCATFIKVYGCDEYFAHNKGILLYEREKDILRQIEEL